MTTRRGRDRGSVLMLVPAGFLIMVILGSIAFDLSLVFLRQRQASSTAVHVANDLATLALDVDHLRGTGEYVLDPVTAEAVAAELLADSEVADDLVAWEVTVIDADEVEVRLVLAVDYVFAKAIPGAADGTEVTAAATAVAVPG